MLHQAPAPNAAPVATVATVPTVAISFYVGNIGKTEFTDVVKQGVIDAISATLPATANVKVYLANIVYGSVNFDVVTVFLDGNSGAAAALVSAASGVRI